MKKKSLFLTVFTALIMIIGAKTCYAADNVPVPPSDIYEGSFTAYADCQYLYSSGQTSSYIIHLVYVGINNPDNLYVSGVYLKAGGADSNGVETLIDSETDTNLMNSFINSDSYKNGSCPSNLYIYDDGKYSFSLNNNSSSYSDLSLISSYFYNYANEYWYKENDQLIYIKSNKILYNNFGQTISQIDALNLFKFNSLNNKSFYKTRTCSSESVTNIIDEKYNTTMSSFEDYKSIVNNEQYIKKTCNGGSANCEWKVVDFSNLSSEDVNNRVSTLKTTLSKFGFVERTGGGSYVNKDAVVGSFNNIINEYKTAIDVLSSKTCSNEGELTESIRVNMGKLNASITTYRNTIDKLLKAYKDLISIQVNNGTITQQEAAMAITAIDNYGSTVDGALDEVVENNQAYYLNYATTYGGVTSNFNTSLTGCDLLSNDFVNFLDTVLWYIRIAGVVLAIVLSLIDYIKAASGFDDKGMAAANKKFITRFILVAVLFLIPAILNFMLSALNISNTAGSIECINSISGEI